MSPLAELGAHIARAQDRTLGPPPTAKAKEHLLNAPASRSRKSTAVIIVMAAFLGIAVLVAWFQFRERSLRFEVSNGGLAVEGQWIGAPPSSPVFLRFSDGTSLALMPGASARVADIDDGGARIVVERGTVEVSVVPLAGARWFFDVGPFAIRVTGTRFRAQWDPSATQLLLELEEGSVVVSGPIVGNERRIASGETLAVSIENAQMQLITSARRHVPESPSSEPTSSAAPLSSKPRDAASPPSGSKPRRAPPQHASGESAQATRAKWLELARAGQYREALDQARVEGFQRLLKEANRDELSTLADAARLAGDGRLAKNVLLTVRRRFAGSSQAAFAAFMLGRLAFDEKRAYDTAARWFETYLTEQPGGAFAREASGRLLEARLHAGDTKAARAAARAYLDAYPNGPHAERARSALDK